MSSRQVWLPRQVGAFPHYGGRWAEWNGTFRDAVRAFVKGTEGPWAAAFASAVVGSPHLYRDRASREGDWWGSHGGQRWRGGRSPAHSVNFVTAHDGFPLADLVAYNRKHNEANGEGNRCGRAWCISRAQWGSTARLTCHQPLRNHEARLRYQGQVRLCKAVARGRVCSFSYPTLSYPSLAHTRLGGSGVRADRAASAGPST